MGPAKLTGESSFWKVARSGRRPLSPSKPMTSRGVNRVGYRGWVGNNLAKQGGTVLSDVEGPLLISKDYVFGDQQGFFIFIF